MEATKKPVEVEYYPCDIRYIDNIMEWSSEERPIKTAIITGTGSNKKTLIIYIATLEGIMTATEGDVIIKGIEGEVYPCKKTIFEKTYNY